MKLIHTREDRIHTTAKHLHYSIKVVLEVCDDCAMDKIKQKMLPKVAEKQDLNPGEMIYLDLSSKNKTSYGGSKNWILIQNSDTKQKLSFFAKEK